MVNYFKSFYSLCAAVLIASTVIALFFLIKLQSGSAQSKTEIDRLSESKSKTVQNGRTSPLAEATNNSLLKTLLEADNLVFDEEFLLTPNVEKTQTLRIKLVNQRAVLKSGFSLEKPLQSTILLHRSKISEEGLARQRALELSPSQILVVSTDERQHVLWWSLENDPRLLRVESSDDQGRLSGRGTVYQNDAELLISLPFNNEISFVHLYDSNWNGSEFQLEPIGKLELPKR